MDEKIYEQCEKCGAEIDPERRVDFTLKDGTRVCEACFVRGSRPSTEQPLLARREEKDKVEPTGINQLYQASFTNVPVTNHQMHFVLAVMDYFSRYLLVLRVSSPIHEIGQTIQLTTGEENCRPIANVSPFKGLQ